MLGSGPMRLGHVDVANVAAPVDLVGRELKAWEAYRSAVQMSLPSVGWFVLAVATSEKP
jgi:hypothetical protein